MFYKQDADPQVDLGGIWGGKSEESKTWDFWGLGMQAEKFLFAFSSGSKI